MLFEDLENLVKEATAPAEMQQSVQQETSTGSELVSKLAESIQDHVEESHSRLGVAKILMAIDILSS